VISDELAQAVARRGEMIAQAVARHGDPGAGPVMAAAVCPSSGYCDCRCGPCLNGQHSCGHRKGCHKNCKPR
jgi:hypothetical protein